MRVATLVYIRELLAENEKKQKNACDILWRAIDGSENRCEQGEEETKTKLDMLRELYEKANKKYCNASAAREDFERHEFS